MEDVPEEERAIEELAHLWQNLNVHDEGLRVDLWDYIDVDDGVAIDETSRDTSLVNMDSSSESDDDM